MAMLMRVVSRATEPHLPTLADALRPLLAAAGANQSFHLRWQNGSVVIEQNSFANVNTAAVDAAVAAAPAKSDALDVKAQINALPLLMKAVILSLIDGINVERARHGAQPITPAQAIAQIVAKVDALS